MGPVLAAVLAMWCVAAVLLLVAIPGELRREDRLPVPPAGRRRLAGDPRERIDPGSYWEPLPRTRPPSWALRGWDDPEVADEPVTWSAVALPVPVQQRIPLLPLTARCRWDDPSPATHEMETLDV